MVQLSVAKRLQNNTVKGDRLQPVRSGPVLPQPAKYLRKLQCTQFWYFFECTAPIRPLSAAAKRTKPGGGRTFSDTQRATGRFLSCEEGEEKPKTKDFAELFGSRLA
jgi:hypothetical protein